MSAHSASHRGGWLSALVAQVSDYVFEPVEETIEPEPRALEPFPVVAVVSAAPRSGATTIARMLAAELGSRADGVAVVRTHALARRAAPPSRAAIRLATALAGAANVQPLGRLCLAAEAPETVAAAARYLAPLVLDLPADGSGAIAAAIADRVVVVAPGGGEPALLDAVASVVASGAVKVANRVADPDAWDGRADIQVPDSRLAARAAALGTRPLGALGAAISALADALEAA